MKPRRLLRPHPFSPERAPPKTYAHFNFGTPIILESPPARGRGLKLAMVSLSYAEPSRPAGGNVGGIPTGVQFVPSFKLQHLMERQGAFGAKKAFPTCVGINGEDIVSLVPLLQVTLQ